MPPLLQRSMRMITGRFIDCRRYAIRQFDTLSLRLLMLPLFDMAITLPSACFLRWLSFSPPATLRAAFAAATLRFLRFPCFFVLFSLI